MTESDLKQIEQALNISLPNAYSSMVTNYPQELLALGQLFRDEGDDDEPYDNDCGH